MIIIIIVCWKLTSDGTNLIGLFKYNMFWFIVGWIIPKNIKHVAYIIKFSTESLNENENNSWLIISQC